jgi:uncharacterized membrane protein
MSELITVGFKGEYTADEVLIDLLKLEEKHKINFGDAVVAIRKMDGIIKIKQSNLLVLTDAVLGSVFGIFGGPVGILVGGVIGAAVGESVKILKHIGISDDFVKSVAEILEPGSSAIFIYVNKSISESVVEELKKHHGKLFRSSLCIKDEEGLVKALGKSVVFK